MTDVLSHFVAGRPTPGSDTPLTERYNPADRRDLVARAPIGTAPDIAAATAAAGEAQRAWRRLTGMARADMLYAWGEAIAARSDELANMICREVGKPLAEARGEVSRAVVICRYYAGECVREIGEVIPSQTADTLQFTLHDPLGVVGLITPWNFPVAIPVWKAAPALAFGNTVVLKPSEHAPATSELLAQTAAAAGLPAGVFNVIHGDGSTGAALLADQAINGMSFTGSQRVGALVAQGCAASNIPFQTEMGGKNVVIVAADADLPRAARLTAGGAFRYAGQKCTATSRVVIDRAVMDDFLGHLESETAKLTMGPMSDVAAMVGPLVTADACVRVAEATSEFRDDIIFGGAIPAGDDWQHGNWCAPVAYRSNNASPLARVELFAPVLTVLEANDLDEAIEIANDTPFGLSASLFTANLGAALDYVRRIEVGLVRVNGDTTGVDPHAPFGGMKGSSSGSREQGRAARDFYTEVRTIQIHP